MGSKTPLSQLLPSLILASQSIARKNLLVSLGCSVISIPTHSDEYHGGTVGREVVQELAHRKMDFFLSEHNSPTLPVLTADTLISYNGLLLGKANNCDEARYHIQLLQGETHTVCSGFSLYLPYFKGSYGVIISGSDEAFVTFHRLSRDQIQQYLHNGDWQGAAGSYRIQGEAKDFISHISGDFTTIVGLPIDAISAILS